MASIMTNGMKIPLQMAAKGGIFSDLYFLWFLSYLQTIEPKLQNPLLMQTIAYTKSQNVLLRTACVEII